MTDATHSPAILPLVRTVDMERPWAWLRAGWRDLMRAPAIGLTYGLCVAAAGLLLTGLLWLTDLFYLILPLTAGFMFLGPLLAVGIYDASRRMARGESVRLTDTLTAWRGNIGQFALMGLFLMLFLLAWVRVATLLFALFFSGAPPGPEPLLLVERFLSPAGLPFLAVGTAIGGVLAALVFAVSVISIPFLLDREDSHVATAIATSVNAVRRNFWTMALWAWLIVLFIGAGLVTLFLGLIVTMPLIGHATWHAYQDIVGRDPASPGAASPAGGA